MKVMIFGGDGMLGHQLAESLSRVFRVHAVLRRVSGSYSFASSALPIDVSYGFDVLDWEAVERLINKERPKVIVNAVGIIKQRSNAFDPALGIEVNALFPHRLARLRKAANARIVHFSTDCVFSGCRGMYRDDDFADANDLYGRTKYLGEVGGEGCLTIRTSIIGRELKRKASLVEWFLSQTGDAKGFRKAVFSGFTTIEMARIVERVIIQHPNLSGVWNVSSEPINKYDLLRLINRYYKLPIAVRPDDEFVCDRSLDSSKFRAATGYCPPSWEEMIREMYERDMESAE